MADVRDLYPETILDHYRRPRNYCQPENANRQADGYNPLCGDKFRVFLRIEHGVIRAIGFTGAGCAIATASASIMTECLTGKTDREARELFETFQRLVTGKSNAPEDAPVPPDLEVFASVRDYPVRVKCSTLAWLAMRTALDESTVPAAME